VEDRTQLTARLPENGSPTPFGHENNVVLAVPFDLATFCTPLPHV